MSFPNPVWFVRWVVGLALLGAVAGGAAEKPDRDWWSFQPIADARPPQVKANARNDIDRFILARLEAIGLAMSPEADRRTLIRRVTFDLTGLPPTPAEVAAFVADKRADAYARLVDRLLASPHYGERWARWWLDVARYADTNGGGFDYVYPNAWRYRDYVVRAFNADTPFDRFITEQLAGDLMPVGIDAKAHADRLTATGFLTLAPKGLGMQDKELMALDVADDQLDVLGRALMGLTISCARCHDHKFDPISTRDYYALAGIFRSTETVNLLNKNPSYWPESPLELPSVTAARKKYLSRKTANTKAAAAVRVKAKAALAKQARGQLAEYLFTAAQVHHKKIEITKIKKGLVPGLVKNLAAHIAKANPKSPLHPFTKAAPAGVGEVTKLVKLEDESFQKLLGDEKKGPLVPGDDAAAFFADPFKMQLAKLSAEAKAIEKDAVPAPVMGMVAREGKVADLKVHVAGDRQRLGEMAPRGVPAVFGGRIEVPAKASGRLELARWLTDAKHPLTARVLVNRVWQGHFGTGLVRTPDNFGKLGDRPSHPQLLDWLARRFIEDGWSLKKLHRRMALSAAYRQSSGHVAHAAKVDSGNRLLWRMNRRRLEAEALRDAMLAVSGQLDRRLGGTVNTAWKPKMFSVNDKNEETANYRTNRRSLYLPVVRGAAVHEMLQLFDFGDPNSIAANRDTTTNAPQALFLMNSPFVREQAKHLAARLAKTAPEMPARIRLAYQLTLAREPSAAERQRATAFLGKGDAAAWQLFCQSLLCLNEFAYLE